MSRSSGTPKLVIVSTGAANLASVGALCRRCSVDFEVVRDPERILREDYVLLPGVGAFGDAMESLRSRGAEESLRMRIRRGSPTMGICLGMQLFFESSEESPGITGIGAFPGRIGRFSCELPIPQLGWNTVLPRDGEGIVRPGWAYFAHSYRLTQPVGDFRSSISSYGEPYIASLEGGMERGRPSILLCQFHPELSGAWGERLFLNWLGLEGGKP